MCICDSTHSIASISNNNSLHIFKVEYASKSCSLSQIKIFDDDLQYDHQQDLLKIQHYNTLNESMLVYGNKNAIISGYDLRNNVDVFKLRLNNRLNIGILTQMIIGPSPYCIIIGTSHGYIIIYDIRFQIPIQIWQHSSHKAIVYLYSIEYNHIPTLYVSAKHDHSIVSYNMINGQIINIYKIHDHSSFNRPKSPPKSRVHLLTKTQLPTLTSCFDHNGMINLTSITTLQQQQPKIKKNNATTNSITSMLLSPNSFMLTAGTDATIRYWDLNHYNQSYWITGYDVNKPLDIRIKKHQIDQYQIYEEISNHNMINEINLSKIQGQQLSLNNKKNPILDMKAIEYPHQLLATATKNGEIQIFG